MGIEQFLWGDKDKKSFYGDKTTSSSDYVKEQRAALRSEGKVQRSYSSHSVPDNAGNADRPDKPVCLNNVTLASNEALPSLDSLRDSSSRSRTTPPAEDIERLRLACQAMWELLRDKHGLSDDDIEDKIQEIDLRDGVADNKMTTTMVVCSSCGRKGKSYRSACLYCGVDLARRPVFSKKS